MKTLRDLAESKLHPSEQETVREAADSLRARALAARLRVEVMMPTDAGADWADVWAKRDAVLIESGGTA